MSLLPTSATDTLNLLEILSITDLSILRFSFNERDGRSKVILLTLTIMSSNQSIVPFEHVAFADALLNAGLPFCYLIENKLMCDYILP